MSGLQLKSAVKINGGSSSGRLPRNCLEDGVVWPSSVVAPKKENRAAEKTDLDANDVLRTCAKCKALSCGVWQLGVRDVLRYAEETTSICAVLAVGALGGGRVAITVAVCPLRPFHGFNRCFLVAMRLDENFYIGCLGGEPTFGFITVFASVRKDHG